MAKVRGAIRGSTGDALYDDLWWYVKGLRKPLVQDRDRNIRRVKLQVVPLVSEQA